MITTRPYNLKTFKQLRQIEVETPAGAKKDWAPVPHATLIAAFDRQIKKRGWELILNPTFATSDDEADMLALYPIVVKGSGVQKSDDYSLMIGLTNSNARRRSIELFVATRIKASNTLGPVVSRIMVSQRRTSNLDLDAALTQATKQATKDIETVADRVRVYKEKEMKAADTIMLLTNTAREGSVRQRVRWSLVGQIMQKHEEYYQGEKLRPSLWTLATVFSQETHELAPAPFKQLDVTYLFSLQCDAKVASRKEK